VGATNHLDAEQVRRLGEGRVRVSGQIMAGGSRCGGRGVVA